MVIHQQNARALLASGGRGWFTSHNLDFLAGAAGDATGN
jgi:hypothetical protein